MPDKDITHDDAQSSTLDEEPLGQKEAERVILPKELPVLPARGVVIYPQVVLPLAFSSARDMKLINDVILGERHVAITAVHKGESETPNPAELNAVGCAATVLKMLKFPDDTVRILIQGLSRIRLDRYTATEPYLRAEITPLKSITNDTIETQALAKSLVDQFQKLVDLSPQLPDELKLAIMNIDDFGRLADVVSATLNLKVEQRQEILETLDVSQRLKKVITFLVHDLSAAELSSKIQSQVKSELDKDQRDFILRRQLKAIQQELGEIDEQAAEVADLRKRIKSLKLPEEVEKEAQREMDRLRNMPPQASEYHVAHTYLEWIIALPWHKTTKDRINVIEAEKVLNEDHYDLEKVKQRILEYLAVRKLKKDSRGPILCFMGPPGTGKTSLGKSIARAMGRKFARVSLGGVRDEAAIRGHRRTYVGALPGRIVQGLRKAETNNPVFMLDEIDKLGADFRGDPAAALLEVLDPEQNYSFTDHYLNVPFDLSHVLFITTANMLDTVPPALLDRMEVLDLPGYTSEEKVAIARQYLIPRRLSENGLKPKDLEFSEEIIRTLISDYTREAGLRNLEREIGSICRKHASEIVRKKGPRKKRRLQLKDLADMLGPAKFYQEVAERTSEPGVATGLAWTQAGGEILFVESTAYPGKGNLFLTGQLGNIMKESAQAAMSYIRAHAKELNLCKSIFGNVDVHVHVPAGAIPKDGPSAGVTILASLVSLFTHQPVLSDVAMTGEITLRGRILPIGGIKEKVLAARRAGIKIVILPKRNENDLAEVPKIAKKNLCFVFVKTIEELLPVAFGEVPTCREKGWKRHNRFQKQRRPKGKQRIS